MKSLKETLQLGLEYHDTLNPKLWDLNTNKLKPEIRGHLLAIANAWAAFTKIPQDAIVDVVISGGNANYNYSPLSDIDVHLRCNFTKMSVVDPEIMKDYIFSKMTLWSIKHPIVISGYPVQLFAQDISDPEQTPINQGVYSLTKNEWEIMPNKLSIDYDNDKMLKDKVNYYAKLIDHLIDSDASVDVIKKLRDKLSNMRAESLHKSGEFSIGNLIYKSLRNSGYLQKLSNFANGKEDKELSL
jgi:hypothetical protein